VKDSGALKRASKEKLAAKTTHDEGAVNDEDAGACPLTYYVGKGNGWKLVQRALDKRGWAQLPFDHLGEAKCTLKWIQLRTMVDYRLPPTVFLRGALNNHITNNSVITAKVGLVETLRSASANVDGKLATRWVPETFLLDAPRDVAAVLKRDAALAEESRAAQAAAQAAVQAAAETGTQADTSQAEEPPAASEPKAERAAANSRAAESASSTVGPLWIYKPPDMNRGNGIRVLHGRAALEKLLAGKGDNDCERDGGNGNGAPKSEAKFSKRKGVLQSYLVNPMLAAGGFKFDIRCYLLVARAVPKAFLGYYHPGYTRLSLKKYSLDPSSLGDRMMHLTNASVQKQGALYAERAEQQIQSIADVAKRIVEEARVAGDADGLARAEASAFFLLEGLDGQICQCMTDVLQAAIPRFSKKDPGCFDLLGFDFMVTSDLQLKLLEVKSIGCV
jgi:hypothetical protein